MEIVGGAKATRGKGPYVYIAIWEGFQTHKEALSCEWKIKHPTNSKKRPKQYNGINGRIKSLNLLIDLDCWTNKSSGMICGLEYNLYVDENLIRFVDSEIKKPNLCIKKLIEFKII